MSNFQVSLNTKNNHHIKVNKNNHILEKMKDNYFIKNILDGKNIDLLKQYENILDKIKLKFSNILIIGIGGSVNGFNFLNEFIDSNGIENNNKIFIINNYLYKDLKKIINKCNLKDTHVFIITKSGKSKEIDIQSNIIISKMISAGLKNIEEHFTLISTKSGLEKINISINKKLINFIDYDKEISGRFSCFSNSLLCPAYFIDNFNIEDFISGAKKCIKDFFLQNDTFLTINEYAEEITPLNKQSVIISYNENVYDNFFLWYEQLISESTGKNKKGITPVCTYGFRDQHSQFQLFLDGNNNKVFTFIGYEKDSFKDPNVKSFYVNHGMHFYTNALKTFEESGLFFRNITLKDNDPKTLGYLLSYFCIETIYICEKLNINPFNQDQIDKFKNNLIK